MTPILTSFTLTNFKSYREARFPLGPLTLLIGANASGKSNAIEALKMVSWRAQRRNSSEQHYPKLGPFALRGGISSFFNHDADNCFISCYFDHDSAHQYTVELIKNPVGAFSFYDQTTDLFVASPLSLKILTTIFFIDAIPSAMRGYSEKYDKLLQSDSSNLSSVLYHLCQDTHQKQTILNFIQSLPEQAISNIDFIETPRDEVMLKLTETFGHQERTYDASLLSDGTLQVLAIVAALLSAPEGSLIVIEEIDNGIHPSRAHLLLANIREIADRRNLRVLLSTHNPALMDALPDEALTDVVFCYRDPQDGDSRLTRLGDIDNFPGLVSQGPLGHLVTTGVVDRFIKSPTTPEERKQKALAWIQAFEEIA
jgi:energy-coupling factor transporter ATP-binding protein EcfA2